MRLQVHDSIAAAAAAHPEPFASAARRSIFSSRPWLEVFERTVAVTEGRVQIFAGTGCGDARAAVVIPAWERNTRRGLLPGRTLTALGNFYSSLYLPLADHGASGWAAQAGRAIEAIAGRPGVAPVMDLGPLPADGGLLDEIEAGLVRAGWLAQRYLAFGNWYLPAAGIDYVRYIEGRPGALRSTLRRKDKGFRARPGARLEVLTEPGEMDRALAAFTAIYAVSWKTAEAYPAFIEAVVRRFADAAAVRVGLAWIGDRPVAAQLWFVHEGVASIFKLAYDPEFAKLSVGTVLGASLFRHVLDVDRVREVDYLTGDEPYKRDWMAARRERFGILGFSPRAPRGLLGAARHLLGRRLASALRTP